MTKYGFTCFVTAFWNVYFGFEKKLRLHLIVLFKNYIKSSLWKSLFSMVWYVIISKKINAEQMYIEAGTTFIVNSLTIIWNF